MSRSNRRNKFAAGHILVLGLSWTIIVLIFAWWGIQEEHQKTAELAIAQARAAFGKDQALRQWATRHGRIYVPVTETQAPDPRMAKVPERDISTPGGLPLTLINPVTIINQLDRDYGHLYGTSGKITSLSATSPRNRPDEWERSALERIQKGSPQVLEFVQGSEGESLRLMQPLIARKGCLLCHHDTGFEIGKPAGGVAISLPMGKLRQSEREAIRNKSLALLVLWLFGLLGLGITAWLLQHQARTRSQALAELKRSEERNRAIVNSALDCIITIDAQDRIVEFNPAAEATFGYASNHVIGRRLAELLVPRPLRKMHYAGLRRQLKTGDPNILGTRIETTALRSDGSEIPVELAIIRVEQEGAPLFTAFLRDITEQRRMQQELQQRASQDTLTGLDNRHTFEQALRRMLHEEVHQGHCLMFMDLDRFKLVNDTSGHAAGDELLKQLAALLRATVQEDAVLARLGGDEFGLLLETCDIEGARATAQTLLQAVNDFRFYWEDKIFTIGMSIGIVAVGDHGTDASHLLSLADAACYRAKEEGRNRYYVYTDMDDVIRYRRAEAGWIQHIENALAEDRFLLYRQPIVPLQPEEDGDQGFMEILLRMRGPGQEIITPNRFLPAAERYNLMPVIDRWVIRSSLAWLAEQPHYRGMLSINLSGTSITDPLFLEFLDEELSGNTHDRGKICFEITETEAITNLSHARRFIEQIKELGCRFALDDFGSGMSSYGYLKDLPVDFLKIDGRFVSNVHSDPVSYAMVKSIHEIGHLMGKRTIAEFVSCTEVMELLQGLGVNYGQGYYLERPSPLEAHLLPVASSNPPVSAGRAVLP